MNLKDLWLIEVVIGDIAFSRSETSVFSTKEILREKKNFRRAENVLVAIDQLLDL